MTWSTFVLDQDIVQASPSMPPISSQELFSVLDEASEKTFLCAGTALSLQKYLFDGEAVKRVLEIKNIVACTSFLIEIELVWFFVFVYYFPDSCIISEVAKSDRTDAIDRLKRGSLTRMQKL